MCETHRNILQEKDPKPRIYENTWMMSVGIILQEIDLAATGLTASADRQQVVDFTSAFHYTEFGMMLQVDREEWFHFLRPLQGQVCTSCFFFLWFPQGYTLIEGAHHAPVVRTLDS